MKESRQSEIELSGFFNFLNNQEVMRDAVKKQNSVKKQAINKKIKTNASLLSDRSSFQAKTRIPTINKDYQFVMLNKSIIEQNKKQQDLINEIQLQSIYNHHQEENLIESYKKWLSKTKNNFIKNQGGKVEQHFIRKVEKNIQQSPFNRIGLNFDNLNNLIANQNNSGKLNLNTDVKEYTIQKKHSFIMVEISSITNIFWNQFQKYSRQQSQGKLFCKLSINLEEQSVVYGDTYFKSFPKTITTEMIPLQKFQTRQTEQGTSTNQGKYSTQQKFCIYFHTQKQNLNLKIDLVLYDVKTYQSDQIPSNQIKQQTQIVIRQEALSFVRIPMNVQKISKSKQIKISNKSYSSGQRIFQKQFSAYQSIFYQQIQTNIPVKEGQKKKNPALKQQKSRNILGILNFKIIDSPHYKLLNKFIPPQFLVWHQDLIPGLMGGYLPKLNDLLYHISPSTEAKSLNFQIQSLQIESQFFLKAKTKVEKIFQHRALVQHKAIKIIQKDKSITYKNFQLSIVPKEIKISIILHNGLIEINRTSSIITQKFQTQKRIQDFKANNLLGLNSKNNTVSIKMLSCPSISTPQVFKQDDCFLIIQIDQTFQMREVNLGQNNQNSFFQVPIAFTFFRIDSIMNNKPIDKRMYEGWYLGEDPFDSINRFKKMKAAKLSKNLLFGTMKDIIGSRANTDNVSLKGNQKSNFSQKQHIFSKMNIICTFKEVIYDQSWTMNRNALQESLILKNQRVAGLNMSAMLTNQNAKIENEKQKFIKQFTNQIIHVPGSKIPKKETRKIIIKQQVVLVQNPQSLYGKYAKQISKNLKNKHIQDLKTFLKQNMANTFQSKKLQKQSKTQEFNNIQRIYQLESKAVSNIKKQAHIYRNYTFNQKQSDCQFLCKTYRQLYQLSSIKSHSIVQSSHLCFSYNLFKMFYNPINKNYMTNQNPFSRITQNNSFLGVQNKDNLSQFRYERTPIELIRTQLTQINYNYLIMINPLSIKPLQTANNSNFAIPNKFFFKIFFWNMESYQSSCFKIDPETGEIAVYIQDSLTFLTTLKHIEQTQNKLSSKNIQIRKNGQKELNKLKLNKVFHFQYGTQQKYSNSKDLFIDFIDYLYNGLMEVRIYDEFQQIGKTYFKLRNLLRKRKNQTSTILEETVHSKFGPICELKMELKSLRKDKPPRIDFQRQQADQKPVKLEQLSKLITTKVQFPAQSKIISMNQILSVSAENISLKTIDKQVDKQKQRIQKFKKNKQEKNKENIKNQNESGQMVQRIIERNYLTFEYKYKVFSFKRFYFFIQLQNRSNKKGFFSVSFNDDDYPYYKKTYGSHQLKIIRNFHNQISDEYKQKILSIQSNKERLLKYKKLNQNFQIQLQDKQKIIVVCEYQTKRKYLPQDLNIKKQKSQQLWYQFNHEHIITVSLLQSSNQSTVSSLAKILICPQPVQNVIQIHQTFRKGQHKLISFPFLLSKMIKQNYQIYINQSRCSLIYESDERKNTDSDRYYNSTTVSDARRNYNETYSNQKFILASVQGRDQLKKPTQKYQFNQKPTIFNSPNKDYIKEETDLRNTGNAKLHDHFNIQKNQKKVKNKQYNFLSLLIENCTFISQNEYPKSTNIQMSLIPKNENIQSQPIFIRLNLSSVEAEQTYKIPLFQSVKSKIKILHSTLVKNQRIPKIIGIVSQDIQFKTKSIWVQLDLTKSYTQIQFKYTSTMYGSRSFEIKLIDPLDFNHFYKKAQVSEFSLEEMQKCYLSKILMNITSPFPSIKSQLILNISLNSVLNKQGYEQPFGYTNSSINKGIFHIYSSHPWFLSVDQKERICEIKSKSQKKLKLKINLKRIQQQFMYALKGEKEIDGTQTEQKYLQSARKTQRWRQILPVVVLSFVSDKVIDHFAFLFKIV